MPLRSICEEVAEGYKPPRILLIIAKSTPPLKGGEKKIKARNLNYNSKYCKLRHITED